MTCSEFAFKIINDYDKYTQEGLSEKYDVPLDLIIRLTKQFNYNHRILGFKKFMIRDDEVLYLQPYIK